MISPFYFALGTVLFMIGLFIEALIFRALHDDPLSLYKLFAVRDKLVRLVVEGKIERQEPHFDALYADVNALLKGSRRLSGAGGWERSEADGVYLAGRSREHARMVEMPEDAVPPVLDEVSAELQDSLQHLVRNHFGLLVVLNERRRKCERMRKERAKELLKMMQERMRSSNHACTA